MSPDHWIPDQEQLRFEVQMNEVRDFGVNQFTGKYLTDTGYKDVVQEQG